MARVDTLLEIEGFAQAWTGSGLTGAPVSWGQTVTQGLIGSPPIATLGVDPITGQPQYGGLSVVHLDMSAQILHRGATPETTLTSDLTVGATSISVTSTSAFPSSGYVWIGKEAIAYGSKNATTFLACVRASLGTTAKAHTATISDGVSRPVCGQNPLLLGRKVYLRRYGDIATTLVYTGRIDALSMSESGYQIDLTTLAARLDDESIATTTRARGTLVPQRLFNLALESEDDRFPAGPGYMMVRDEIVGYRSQAYPAVTATCLTTGLTSSGYGNGFTCDREILPNDQIRFTDSATSAVITANVTRVERIGGTGWEVYHDSPGTNPVVSGSITTPLRQSFTGLRRALFGTEEQTIVAGDELVSIALVEGDAVESVLQLLISGSGDGSQWDTLPDGYGAGIPSAEVDTSSFDALRPYSLVRLHRYEDPISPGQILSDLASLTGGRIFVDTDGLIRAARDWALYPDSAGSSAINTSGLVHAAIPGWRIELSGVYNAWAWPLANGHKAIITDQRSVELYGRRELPEPPSQHQLLVTSLSTLVGVAISVLARWTVPAEVVEFLLPAEENSILRPGDSISLTLLHLPDSAGDEGLTSQVFEVIEYAPAEDGTARVVAIRARAQDRVGLIAPAGIVQAFDIGAGWIQLEAGSDSRFAADTDRSAALSSILQSGEDGQDDIDWWLVGDEITIWDASTLGGTPTTASTTVTNVDPATRRIDVNVVPAWIAAGDLVRLATYATVLGGGVAGERTEYFCALADATDTVGSDSAYKWGA